MESEREREKEREREREREIEVSKLEEMTSIRKGCKLGKANPNENLLSQHFYCSLLQMLFSLHIIMLYSGGVLSRSLIN